MGDSPQLGADDGVSFEATIACLEWVVRPETVQWLISGGSPELLSRLKRVTTAYSNLNLPREAIVGESGAAAAEVPLKQKEEQPEIASGPTPP
eukprot:CAMPEP_0182917916 /NCGR_PEP_ID=MMETSP0105_2-20130417/1778_1 /TAXON_ID=81532 ORGANISM="Acanthoeca-like sp., Strain 10tr" /NCGR_SAMPLE_ID=MMETSP0105_2 /ASSEMBLY_ACC=CAM_ASM_000205 /LENGTH=92 /DNA_ID=CAMNT_0025054939 /DNA_START=22 /DNA_END=297 /DNA_ORIENTATION=+